MAKIAEVYAHQILDSNGGWTIETWITTENGKQARASVPAGHSVGTYEAKLVPSHEGVERINNEIAENLKGRDLSKQNEIDSLLVQLDGTENKSNLGANTILSVSLACLKAAALAHNMNLYEYINKYYHFPELSEEMFPTPLLNLINGGAHASNKLEFQSFMVAPGSFYRYSKGLELGVEVYHKLREDLMFKNLNIDVGEEGGFAPSGLDIDQACHFIVEAIRSLKVKPGSDMFLAIDVAASTFFSSSSYQTKGVLGAISADQLRDVYINLVKNFPILYLEDPFAEDEWEDWSNLKSMVGESVEIVGDDITVTNINRLKKAIKKDTITGIIIKPDQIGTLTETMQVIKEAVKNDLTIIVSHRSGETAEDTFISDLSVGVGADYIKAGAPARGERTVKYNRLLEIEQDMIAREIIPPLEESGTKNSNGGGNAN